jgi:hypothetical protein
MQLCDFPSCHTPILAYLLGSREASPAKPKPTRQDMILAKVIFGQAFFTPNNDRRTMANVFELADFSGDGSGYFEAIYAGF